MTLLILRPILRGKLPTDGLSQAYAAIRIINYKLINYLMANKMLFTELLFVSFLFGVLRLKVHAEIVALNVSKVHNLISL